MGGSGEKSEGAKASLGRCDKNHGKNHGKTMGKPWENTDN